MLYSMLSSGDEDGIALDAFVIVLKGFVLEDGHFVVMPGGGSSEGDGSASTNGGSVVSMPVAVEVGSLQPFQVKGDPHSILHLASRISNLSLSVGSDNEQLRVGLENGRMSTSEIS